MELERRFGIGDCIKVLFDFVRCADSTAVVGCGGASLMPELLFRDTVHGKKMNSSVHIKRKQPSIVPVQWRKIMTKRFGGAGKLAVLGLAVLALPLGASAHGWGGNGHHGDYRGGYSASSHGGYHGRGGYDGGGYGHDGGHWSGGQWIAGAIVAGAVLTLINDVTRPAPVYYDAPVVEYRRSPSVVYDDYGPPVVRRRVVETLEYQDPYQTRYVREDGDDGD
jgi:hypothetical protein